MQITEIETKDVIGFLGEYQMCSFTVTDNQGTVSHWELYMNYEGQKIALFEMSNC